MPKLRWPDAAVVLTVLTGCGVLFLQLDSLPHDLSWSLVLELFLLRIGVTTLSVFFYLRGGVFLVVWWDVLLQLRQLPWPGGC